MEVTGSIPRAALDTLSGQVAVLDEGGTIVFTNTAWGTVDGDGASPEREGVNYFEAIDPNADRYAADAIEGIRDVLDGRRDSYRLEYPCQTPEQKRWFLMRATAFSLGGDRFVTVTHIDITDRREAELQAESNAERAERERNRLERLVERINGLVQDVTKLLVEADSRETIERGVCRRLVEQDSYAYAWIADADFARERLTVRAEAGTGGVDLAGEEFLLGADAGPTARAYVDRRTVVAEAGDDSWPEEVYGTGAVESLIAVPLVSRETCYGVLTVCGHGTGTFDEQEQVVLEALGRAIANARNALVNRVALTTDNVVELSFTVADERSFLSRLSAELDGPLSCTGSVYDDGAMRLFFRVEDDPDRVLELAAEDDALREAALLGTYDEESLVQFTLDSSLLSALADRGAVTNSVEASAGTVRYTVELSQEADARSVFEYVDDRYDRTELVGYHEHERPVKTRRQFSATLEDRLTDRQLTALQIAYHSGYFDWPREVDGDELAAMMDISRSTFHQHLRVAERKVLDAFLDDR